MHRFFTWPIVSFYSLCVVIASILPVETPEQVQRIAYFDKFAHLLMYLVLAWLLINTLLRKKTRHPLIICFCYAFFLGISLECIQYFLPFRSFEASDMLANTAGIIIGTYIRIS